MKKNHKSRQSLFTWSIYEIIYAALFKDYIYIYIWKQKQLFIMKLQVKQVLIARIALLFILYHVGKYLQ